jgi:type VII secretion integral membrane protein EccD
MLVAGAGATLVAVLLAVVALPAREPLFPAVLAVVATMVAAVLAGGLRSTAGLDWTGVAAVLVLLCVAVRPAVPMVAFKLAGMALPPLPVEPGDLQEDIDPEPGAQVLARTARADRYMTALHAACGVVSTAGLVRLALSPGWMPVTVAGLVGLAQVLASRPMTSSWHRLALGLPAFAGLVAFLLSPAGRPAAGSGPAIPPMVLALLLAAAAAGCAHVLPRRRLTPIWGHVGDWAHTLALVVAVPLAACILGAIGLIRSVVG